MTVRTRVMSWSHHTDQLPAYTCSMQASRQACNKNTRQAAQNADNRLHWRWLARVTGLYGTWPELRSNIWKVENPHFQQRLANLQWQILTMYYIIGMDRWQCNGLGIMSSIQHKWQIWDTVSVTVQCTLSVFKLNSN